MTNRFKRLLKKGLFLPYVLHHRLLHHFGVLPFCTDFGFSRGTPVGRYYIQQFLTSQAHHIEGRILDFGDNRYASLFPNSTSYEIVDIESKSGVDYVCDIHTGTAIPNSRFDAVVCCQVLEHLRDPQLALRVIHQKLKPGGILLLSAPFINQVHYVPTDFWRFTPDAIRRLFESAQFERIEIDFGGNSLVSTGSLLGMVAEDFTGSELSRKDSTYPYNILAIGRKPPK